ncbi:MAG: DUF4339 domain-containing protein [Verrucomicrobiae bacterium]|nr:DUF4339 domain-containing protein [Verrucomicrobiae bacterium]
MIYVQKDGQQLGPFEVDQLHEQLQSGAISPEDYAWQEGLAEWMVLQDLLAALQAAAAAADPAAGEGAAQETGEKPLRAFALSHLRAGKEPEEVVAKLIEMGVPKDRAKPLVQGVFDENAAILDTLRLKEQLDPKVLYPTLLGGLLALLTGSIIWGVFSVLTGGDRRFMGPVIGALCALGPIYFSGGRRGKVTQVIATGWALIAYFAMHLFFLYYFASDYMNRAGLGMFTEGNQPLDEVVAFYKSHPSRLLTIWDLIFFPLTLVVPWFLAGKRKKA